MYKRTTGSDAKGKTFGKKFGAGKSFGARKSFNGGGSYGRDSYDRDSERPELHDATCSECGKPCQVPFIPRGGRPVFCSNCFKKDDSSETKRYGSRDGTRSAGTYEKRPFKSDYSGGDKSDQMKDINAKLDRILKALGAE